jgi:hypothetical protein
VSLIFWHGGITKQKNIPFFLRWLVMAIQVSTVASESVFSAGGRVIDPYRSRLDPEMVEALICTKDWIAATNKGVGDHH